MRDIINELENISSNIDTALYNVDDRDDMEVMIERELPNIHKVIDKINKKGMINMNKQAKLYMKEELQEIVRSTRRQLRTMISCEGKTAHILNKDDLTEQEVVAITKLNKENDILYQLSLLNKFVEYLEEDIDYCRYLEKSDLKKESNIDMINRFSEDIDAAIDDDLLIKYTLIHDIIKDYLVECIFNSMIKETYGLELDKVEFIGVIKELKRIMLEINLNTKTMIDLEVYKVDRYLMIHDLDEIEKQIEKIDGDVINSITVKNIILVY